MSNDLWGYSPGLPFGGFATTLSHQYQRRNIDLCGYQHSNYFAILVPEMGLYSKVFATEANDYQNNIITIIIIIIIIIIML